MMMNQVTKDDYSNFHPSIFQSVDNDKIQFKGLIDWKSPEQINNPVSKEENKYAGTGFHRKEVEYLQSILQPIADRPLDNSMPTILFFSFFSGINVDFIQSSLKESVFSFSRRRIGNQSEEELKNLMQHVYCDYSRNIDEYNTPKNIARESIKREVARLSKLTVDLGTPIIVNEMEQYIQFQKDFRRPFSSKSLDRPQNSSLSGTRIYRKVDDLFSGTQPFYPGPNGQRM